MHGSYNWIETAKLIGYLFILISYPIGLIWLWFRVLRRPRTESGTCGRCGYCVTGLKSMNCPECGADFREVGISIRGPSMAKPTEFVLVWLIIMPAPAIIAGISLMTSRVSRRSDWMGVLLPLLIWLVLWVGGMIVYYRVYHPLQCRRVDDC